MANLSDLKKSQNVTNRVVSASSSGTFTTSSTSYVDVTNLNATITTTGGKVRAYLIPEDTGSEAGWQLGIGAIPASSQSSVQGFIGLSRDGGNFHEYSVFGDTQHIGVSGTRSTTIGFTPPVFEDSPSAGTYTYRIRTKVAGFWSQTSRIYRWKLVLEEVK